MDGYQNADPSMNTNNPPPAEEGRRPFTSLSQEEADLALARLLQQQVRYAVDRDGSMALFCDSALLPAPIYTGMISADSALLLITNAGTRVHDADRAGRRRL
jgi:hypothetical protein